MILGASQNGFLRLFSPTVVMPHWLSRIFQRKKKIHSDEEIPKDNNEFNNDLTVVEVKGPRFMKQIMGFNDSLEVVRQANKVKLAVKPPTAAKPQNAGKPQNTPKPKNTAQKTKTAVQKDRAEERTNSIASAEVSLQPISHARRDSAKQMKKAGRIADALGKELSQALTDFRKFRSSFEKLAKTEEQP